MKSILTLLLLMGAGLLPIQAQNVGIGTSLPSQKLQVNGNLLIQHPIIKTTLPPTAAQTFILVNGGSYNTSDSTGLIYDPSGPAANYIANINGNINIYNGSGTRAAGIEIDIQEIGLGTGDSLIIRDIIDFSKIYLRVGNNYSTPGTYTFHASNLALYFKSNSDGIVGSGFKIVYKLLTQEVPFSSVGIYQPAGNVLFFDAPFGNLTSGYSSITGYSRHAVALGSSTVNFGGIAIGESNASFGGTAVGLYANASGSWSTALGRGTAQGQFATAGGASSATANTATAFGSSTASNSGAVALGSNVTASGAYSFAAGRSVNASTQGGFFLGDSDPNNKGVRTMGVQNQLAARFNGGYYFISSDVASDIGVRVIAGGNAWTTISDVKRKENFTVVDGESILKKIATMPPPTSWNYKGQNPKNFRHYGPMAQDFYAAFGKDRYGTIGCDTLINQADFLGISFTAIQALEKRTQKLELLIEQNESLRKENAEIKKQNEILLALFKTLEVPGKVARNK